MSSKAEWTKAENQRLETELNTFLKEAIVARETNMSRKAEWTKAEKQRLETELNTFLKEAIESKEGMDKLTAHYKISGLYNYSFYNSLLIMMQGGTIAQSFNKWTKLERMVNKGEKSHIRVYCPMFKKETINGITEDKLIGFKLVPVFDVAQTEGKELEYDHNSDNDMLIDYSIVKDVMSKLAGAEVVEKFTGTARGWSDGKELTVSAMSNDTDKAKTLIHETVHHLIHTSDKAKKASESLSREAKEVEAESVTYLVLSYLGMDFELSKAYVSSWKSGIKDARTSTIIRTSDKLIKALKKASPEEDLMIAKI